MVELGGVSEAEAKHQYLDPIPLSRVSQIDEIAALVGFLAGSSSVRCVTIKVVVNINHVKSSDSSCYLQ